MSLEQRAKILEIAIHTQSNRGVREIVHLLRLKTSNVISMLRKMSEEQLIEIQREKAQKRGKPKNNITATPLGKEFLETYQRLKNKPLKARKADLRHAARDAHYARRLADNGHSTFQVFMELNMIASNINQSSKNNQAIQ